MWYANIYDFSKKLFSEFMISFWTMTVNFWWKLRWQKNIWIVVWKNFYNNWVNDSLYKRYYYDFNSFWSTSTPTVDVAVLVPTRTINFPFWINSSLIKRWKNIIYKPEVLFANAFTYAKWSNSWNKTYLLSRITWAWYWKNVTNKTSYQTLSNSIYTKYADVKTLIKTNSELFREYYYWNINKYNVDKYTESQLRKLAYDWKLYDIMWTNLVWWNKKFKNKLIYEDWSKPWKLYFKIDSRYWYIFDNVWYCWDWIIQKSMWEECEIWDPNCDSDCRISNNLCWNWVVDSWEECDYWLYNSRWFYWDDNPCTKNCTWKKPWTCWAKILFFNYDKQNLWNTINPIDNWIDIMNQLYFWFIVCSKLPKWWEWLSWFYFKTADWYKNINDTYLTIWSNKLFKPEYKSLYDIIKSVDNVKNI